MPELHEVETIIRGLQGPLLGRTFTSIQIGWGNAVRTSHRVIARELPGRRIEHLDRRGKYLHFILSGNRSLILHLKMSGDLLVEPGHEPRHPHVRTVFTLDNGHELRFKDPRKFGRVYFVTDPAEVTGRLGPEPLSDEFTCDQFKELFTGRRGRLKPLLLNQQFIAGLGNIYAAESCFDAGISPRRLVQTLRPAELERLHRGIRKVLRRGIMHKGASFDAVYRGGTFQDHFKAYGRTGERCLRCTGSIRRIVLGGRSTHYCSRCQR